MANSPIMIRRDSILKHSGSIKHNEKRVSIKHDQPVFVEYLSEKRPQVPTVSATPHQPTVQAQSQAQGSARPASLILTKGDRPAFKLVRSSSIDQHEPLEKLDDVNTFIEQHNTIMMNNLNANHQLDPLVKEDDDESMPLVQTSSNGPNKIASGHSHNTGNL